MQYPSHLSPDQNIVRLVYHGTLSMAEPIEEFSTWLLTGTAAIIALIIVNVESVTDVISENGLRWGLALFTISILAGVFAKQIGIALRKGLVLVEELYAEFETEKGKEMLHQMKMNAEALTIEISSPFFWPFNHLVKRGGDLGAKDPLSAEKRYIKLFCIQLYASYLQGGLGALGLLVMAFNIK